ncbi:MAG: monofunctional biosynthetic peptidoglycan transglycosylase [Pseudomonadota bacterium]
MTRKPARKGGPKGSPNGKRSKKLKRGRVWRVLRWPVKILLWSFVIVCLWVFAYRFVNPPGGIYMASETWRLGGIERDWQDLEEISPRLARSVIAAEDARFCDHYGFDIDAIRGAIEANRAGKRVYGASTISQQVAKNVFLWHKRSWVRKGLEAGFTVLIELLWPKRRIVEVYLNTSEFAEGVFGAEAAAQAAFGRPAIALTPTQAARLAAVLPNPKGRSASRPSSSVRRRAARILDGAETIRAQGRDGCVF